MTRLPRTLRLDGSDAVVFERAAAPGEWAVPGGFAFWEEDPAAMPGRRRQAFRAGFLGLGSFGWATLVEVAEATAAQREDALAALAGHLRAAHGAPDEAAARAAAGEEIGFAESLCAGHAPGTVIALARDLDAAGAVRERFRTLHRRAEGAQRDPRALPVFALVESDEGEDLPDLVALGGQFHPHTRPHPGPPPQAGAGEGKPSPAGGGGLGGGGAHDTGSAS
ncbi:MAG: hypothetical protein K2X49_01065 [Acetobacteraceae bacterium]|nr:hypothetical protein [Acetobacteraceae bacterium]